MTAEELLNSLSNQADLLAAADDDDVFVIDAETRTITVPDSQSLFGVTGDKDVERKYFQCPKIVGDNIDLSTLQVRINFQNANGDKDQYIVEDVKVDGDNITFSWLLSRKVTKYRGNVSFIVCAVEVSGEIVQNEWNTTLATAQVLEGLEVDDPAITEEEADVIAQLLGIMKDTSEQAVNEVGIAKESAISAIAEQQRESTSAVQDAQNTAVSVIESTGKSIEESLPSDYVELENRVDSAEDDIGKIYDVLNRFNFVVQIKSSLDDLNDYTNPGIYYWDSDIYPVHGVLSANPAGMLVFPYSSDGVVQIMYKDATRIYIRSYNGSVWSEWMCIDTSLVFTSVYLQERSGNYITTRNGNRITVRVEG